MRVCLTACFFISCLVFSASAFSQKISGRVLNEGGKGAAFVTVQFRDKSNSVKTNSDGTFTIIAKKLPDTLVFTSLGYEPYKVVVDEKTLADPSFEVVLLSAREKAMSEVVVTAYGKKADLYEAMPYSTSIASDKSGIRIRGSRSSETPGGYIAGKKLFLLDSVFSNKDSVIYKSGLLTAGEINDFNKWKMWEDFQENEFKTWSLYWGLAPKQRYCVQLQNKDHSAIIGQEVSLISKKTGRTVWQSVTDNTGKAELWAHLDGLNDGDEYIISSKGFQNIQSPSAFENGINKMEINTACSLSNTIDIAFVVDATGSMGDEIDFLKLGLEDVIRNTFSQYADLDLHVGSVFYRDKGDEYLTRHVDFQTDLLKVLNFIKLQRAGGGGDTPESVDEALKLALDSLAWSETARSRILFLVLDAPPHDYAKQDMYKLIEKAAAKGVRIVPVVCSGAEKSTEFLMRSIALATNGTYVFLTDNSGIGLPHIKPTTDVFTVEFLNSLLQRIIKQMVFANKCAEQKEAETFQNTPPNLEKIKIYPNPTKGNITIESKAHLKEIFITDFTGKILMRIETNEKQTKWNVSLSAYPNATYLVKYITTDDRWGAEKVVLIH